MNILGDIVRRKREEVAAQKKKAGRKTLARSADTGTRDFRQALCQPGLSLIAEIKYRSPSAGVLPDQRDPVTRACSYVAHGARALSVLTDRHFFGGSCEYLTMVRAHTAVPVLRKDFIIDEFQIFESRFLGADAILLIVRLLSEQELMRFITIAHELEMTCLVEAHTEDEIARAASVHAQCIGINSRDLDTLEIDIERSIGLKPLVPAGCVSVAESGVRTRQDMERLEAAGFDGVLIGQAIADPSGIQGTGQSLLGRV